MLAYGCPVDSVDEYLWIGEFTVLFYLRRFCDAIIARYSQEYLRQPTADDLRRILAQNEQRGFPGMVGCLDCCHWQWKNCPSTWQGQFVGKEEESTVVLEVICSYNLWIWHAFFGMPGSHNNINVMEHSPLFAEIVEGRYPDVSFHVNGHEYYLPYFLTDGIYPDFAVFVKSITNPLEPKVKVSRWNGFS